MGPKMFIGYEDFDPDVLGVLRRGDVSITFVNAPEAGIGGKDFSVISWTTDHVTIAVSDEYLNGEIDAFVARGVADVLENNASEDEVAYAVKTHVIRLFSEKLTLVSEQALSSVRNPLELSVDYALEQLLADPE